MRYLFTVSLHTPGFPVRFGTAESVLDDLQPQVDKLPSLKTAIDRLLQTGVNDRAGRFELVIEGRQLADVGAN